MRRPKPTPGPRPDRPMSRCRSCRALVIWAKSRLGKSMQLNAMPTPEGNLVLLEGKEHPGLEFRHATLEERAAAKEPGTDPKDRLFYTSHFDTCPRAAMWRNRKGPDEARETNDGGD